MFAMRHVTDVIRMKSAGSAAPPRRYGLTIRRFEAAGLIWPLRDDIADAVLEARLFAKDGNRQRKGRVAPGDGRPPPAPMAPQTRSESTGAFAGPAVTLGSGPRDVLSARLLRVWRGISGGHAPPVLPRRAGLSLGVLLRQFALRKRLAGSRKGDPFTSS